MSGSAAAAKAATDATAKILDADCLSRARDLLGPNPDMEFKASLKRVIGDILAEKKWTGYLKRFSRYHEAGEPEIVARVAAYYETSKAYRIPQELDTRLAGLSLDEFLYGG